MLKIPESEVMDSLGKNSDLRAIFPGYFLIEREPYVRDFGFDSFMGQLE